MSQPSSENLLCAEITVQRPLDGQHAEKERLWHGQPRMGHLSNTSSPQTLRVILEEGEERLEEPEVVDDCVRTVFSGHDKAGIHMNSAAVTARQNASMAGVCIPLLAEELLAIGGS